jgi:hypothetical protein
VINSDITYPTVADLKDYWDAPDYDLIKEEIDDSWRHGNYVFAVFRRISDGTYWGVSFCRSGDGETDGLRDGDVDDSNITRLMPVEMTITDYVSWKAPVEE